MINSGTEPKTLLAGLDTDWRLLALWGPPGVGKSFLARRAFPCGTGERWVSVAFAVSADAQEVNRQLVRAVCPGNLASDDSPRALCELLNAEAPLGLVLDDVDDSGEWLEQVLPELLRGIPDLRVVLTSRARPDALLRQVVGALAVEVTPFDEAAAAALFGSLARHFGAEISEAQAPFVLQLCHELGGLPLALELAAARLDVLPVPALLHRIRSQGMQLAQAKGAGRHATLEAAIVSAWQGLDVDLQALLMLIAWPPRGASVADIEAVLDLVDGPELLPRGSDCLELSSALRGRAWLARDAERLVLSPPLRRFVLARVPAQRAQAIELAWAEYFALSETDTPLENLEAVLQRATSVPQLSTRFADAALRVISRSFAAPLELGGTLGSGLERVLAKVIERSHSSGAALPLICEAMVLQSKAQRARGDAQGASALALRALDFARRAGQQDLELVALLSLSRSLAEIGQRKDAHSALERARDLVGPASDSWRSFDLAEGYFALQELDAARVQAERCLARATQSSESDALCRVAAALLLGDVAIELSDAVSASRHLDAAGNGLAALAAGAEVSGEVAAGLLTLLGFLRGREALHAQRLAVAETHFREATEAFQKRGLSRQASRARYHLGIVQREQGQSGASFVELELALQGLALGSREWCFGALHLAQLEREARAESRALGWFSRVREQAQRTGRTDLVELASALSRGGPSPFAAERSLRELDLRVLERCASRRQTQSLRSEPESWLVARDGSWFRPPGGDQVALGKRKSLGAILAALAEAREQSSGCSRAQLIEAGWPGERILEAAATQRLRVALSTLRKLGLEPLIRTLDDGYALGSDVPVARV
ncbi:MAG: NB-ARC domain-containing protein [Polyangiaceae bacterium]